MMKPIFNTERGFYQEWKKKEGPTSIWNNEIVLLEKLCRRLCLFIKKKNFAENYDMDMPQLGYHFCTNQHAVCNPNFQARLFSKLLSTGWWLTKLQGPHKLWTHQVILIHFSFTSEQILLRSETASKDSQPMLHSSKKQINTFSIRRCTVQQYLQFKFKFIRLFAIKLVMHHIQSNIRKWNSICDNGPPEGQQVRQVSFRQNWKWKLNGVFIKT